MKNTKVAKHISEWFIKPKFVTEESKQPYYLAPMDLLTLCFPYNQKGLLFTKPSHLNTQKFLQNLKNSLSLTLVHFYPLAGRLVMKMNEERHESVLYIDCNKGPGVRFIHASLDMTLSDILSPTYTPTVVHSFFDLNNVMNYEGDTKRLLSVQITELTDGFFIGCSVNHAVVDGTSFWNFWNVWSEIHMTNCDEIPVSRLPVYEKRGPTFALPFTHPDEFVSRRHKPPKTELVERVFHFSGDALARLKNQVNTEINTNKISSFQALAALCWRSIVRANKIPKNEVSNCRLAAGNRQRVNPALPQWQFGNYFLVVKTSSTVGELLEHSLGWAALLVHKLIVNHGHKDVEEQAKKWVESPYVYQTNMFDPNSILIASSPRFNMFGNEFGVGKPVAVRTGSNNKFSGKVISFQGYEEGDSVGLEICLPPHSMAALESDPEFMAVVSAHQSLA